MKIVGMVVLLIGAAYVPNVSAQDATPKPDINLTLTETLNRLAPGPSTRDDIREIPPPKNDKLRDTRVTVIVGSPECLPGEDAGFVPRTRRPVRTR